MEVSGKKTAEMETPKSKEQGKGKKMYLKLSLVEHHALATKTSHNFSNAGDLVYTRRFETWHLGLK